MAPTYEPQHVVVGRYRVEALLGVGRTAEVYLAEDTSLQRRVVIKVLLARLAAHEDVRRAFRDRIVRAATLSHPHLARVFDGGQEAGAIFMITEYLSGGSLEDVLRAGRPLSVDDGARLGRDVAGALAYAHENGFVHGSLAPQKLLFDGEGRVRVSDLALAGLASEYREQLSADDVRYLSPEQAEGLPATSRSDVYALALILFEAVTGSPAFEGASTEAVLRARLTSPLPVRLELGTLDMLLAQAAVPDPRLRLDAEQFSQRLGAVVGDSAPVVVRSATEPAPLLANFAPPPPRNSIGFRAPSADQITGATPVTEGFARAPRQRVEARGPSGPVGRTPRFERGAYELPRAPRRRWGFLVAALVIVVAAAGAGAAWRAGVFKKNLTVPNLVGLNYVKASQRLVGGDFTLVVNQRVNSTSIPVNDIVRQSPAANTSVKSGGSITVTVSSGPVTVALPTSLVGETCVVATQQLAAVHLVGECPSTQAIYSATTVGDVARVLYQKTVNPTKVPAGATVLLQLSKGPATTTTAAGSTTTAPSGATTTSTSTTTTTVAGEGPRAVPNVVGDDRAQVYAAFHEAGLYFVTTGPDANTTKWTVVVSESPVAGTSVPWHSTVTLAVK